MTRVKGIKYLGKINGIDQFEEYEVEEQSSQEIIDYGSKVTELIREKYSLDDELAITNNRMAVFDANLLPKENEDEYNREYYAYQMFREECKKKAREICGIVK